MVEIPTKKNEKVVLGIKLKATGPQKRSIVENLIRKSKKNDTSGSLTWPNNLIPALVTTIRPDLIPEEDTSIQARLFNTKVLYPR